MPDDCLFLGSRHGQQSQSHVGRCRRATDNVIHIGKEIQTWGQASVNPEWVLLMEKGREVKETLKDPCLFIVLLV